MCGDKDGETIEPPQKPTIHKPNKCDRDGCTKSFRKPWELKRHLQAHDRGTIQKTSEEPIHKPNKCDRDGCTKSFRKPWELNRHLQTHDRGSIQKTSEEPPKKPTIHKSIKCDRDGCTKSFGKPFELNRHLQAHDRGTVREISDELASRRIFECRIDGCSQGFTRRWKLKCHQQSKHKEVILNENKSSPGKSYKDVGTEREEKDTPPERLQTHELTSHSQERPFKCDVGECGKSYTNKCHLQRHKHQSHSLELDKPEQAICKVEDCGKIFVNKYTLKSHMEAFHIDVATPNDSVEERLHKKRSDIEKLHKCDEPGCNAAFTRPYRLKNHKMSVHGGEKPFKCFYKGCNNRYTNESHLTRHVYITHASRTDINKQVICGMEGCGMMLANKNNLKKHIARNHREFPFSCSVCNEKFKRKTQLHAHKVEIHEAEAPYKCKSCPKTFIPYHLYQKHSSRHKAYQCDCEKFFDRWSKLLEHRRTECTALSREYKCVICDKVFPAKSALTEHSITVHLPDSQNDLRACPYLNCTRAYKHKKNLNQHIKHFHDKISDEITCPKEGCEMVFKSNKNVKQHIRIVHSGLPPKVRKPRRPRKDRGTVWKSMASKLSGVEVSKRENVSNILRSVDGFGNNRDFEASKKDSFGNVGNVFEVNKVLKIDASGMDIPVCPEEDIEASKGLENMTWKIEDFKNDKVLQVDISSTDRAACNEKEIQLKEDNEDSCENLKENTSTDVEMLEVHYNPTSNAINKVDCKSVDSVTSAIIDVKGIELQLIEDASLETSNGEAIKDIQIDNVQTIEDVKTPNFEVITDIQVDNVHTIEDVILETPKSGAATNIQIVNARTVEDVILETPNGGAISDIPIDNVQTVEDVILETPKGGEVTDLKIVNIQTVEDVILKTPNGRAIKDIQIDNIQTMEDIIQDDIVETTKDGAVTDIKTVNVKTIQDVILETPNDGAITEVRVDNEVISVHESLESSIGENLDDGMEVMEDARNVNEKTIDSKMDTLFPSCSQNSCDSGVVIFDFPEMDIVESVEIIESEMTLPETTIIVTEDGTNSHTITSDSAGQLKC